eukprot:191375_1
MVNAATESILLGLLSLFGGSSFGMSSLGVALIFEIGYFMLGSMGIFTSETLTEANVYLTVAFLPMAFVEAGYLRKHWNIKFVFFFGISTACFTILGIFILKRNDNIWLARALGIFLLLSFIILCCIRYRNYKNNNINMHLQALEKQNQSDTVIGLMDNTSSTEDLEVISPQDQISKQSIQENGIEWNVNSCVRIVVLIVMGMISGLLRGLWGVAGVPIMFFALLTNINKDEFRASTAFAMILSETVAVVQLLIMDKKLKKNHIMQYIVIIIGGFIGLIIGNYLSPYLNQHSFHILIMYLIFCGAVILTSRGFIDNVTDLIVSIVLTIIGGVLFCYWLYHSCKSNKKSPESIHKSPINLQEL